MELDRIRALFAQRRAGHSLPQALYNGPDIFSFDMHAIYGQSWLMAGFECELPKPATYVAIMIGEWPVIIVRDRKGEIRAFHNSCRHRGSMICAVGSGAVPKLVCPYHRWTYDLDGSLFAAGRMPADFDKTDHGLKPIALECVEGVMFICLADDSPAFDSFRTALAPFIAPHNLRNAKVAFESVLVEQANWKLVMENGRECYHCATGHPELAKTFPVGISAHFDYGDDPAPERFARDMAAHGLQTGTVEGDWWQVARFPLNEGCVSISMDGQSVSAPLMCDVNGGNVGSVRWALDPHSFSHATGDYVFMFSAMPVSPTHTHVIGKWLVHKDAVEGVDYDIDTLTELWTRTNLQDKILSENNQAGVNSLGYTPGPYSEEAEMLVQRFVDFYCSKAADYLADHSTGLRRAA